VSGQFPPWMLYPYESSIVLFLLTYFSTNTEEKGDDSKDNFYVELEEVFDHFPKSHMKILLRDFNAKVSIKSLLVICGHTRVFSKFLPRNVCS
jgi:hypothetical protein